MNAQYDLFDVGEVDCLRHEIEALEKRMDGIEKRYLSRFNDLRALYFKQQKEIEELREMLLKQVNDGT